MKIALVIALEDEAQGINGYPVYLSGCGKVNATIATMKAIYEGANLIEEEEAKPQLLNEKKELLND